MAGESGNVAGEPGGAAGESGNVVGQSRVYHDPEIAGRRVQADGGGASEERRVPFRESYEGTLTGRRFIQGDPPWHWLELGELTQKPANFEDEFVWCEESFVYFLDA